MGYYKCIYEIGEINSMETLYYTLKGNSEDEEILKRAGNIIKNGGLVAFPTETVYGLGGNALDESASAKIYAAKGRPSDNPLIVHIADVEALELIAEEITPQARLLASRFWPGPLTMVLKKKAIVPPATTGGLETVAVRMPSPKATLDFIRYAGGYVAAPSANLSGRPSPTKAEHVLEDMNGRIEMILDQGQVGIGVESTIIDLTGDIPTLLRPGYIGLEQLKEVLGEVECDRAMLGSLPDGTHPKAPGMKYKHYAPKGELYIVRGSKTAVICKINELVDLAKQAEERVAVIATAERAEGYKCENIFIVGSRSDEETIARNLFDVLRNCDAEGIDRIYAEELDTPQLGMAVMNRLIKAAAHRIIIAE